MTTSQPTSGFARDVTQCQMQIVTALSGTAHECSVPLLIALIAGGNIIIRVRPDDVLTAQKLASNILVQTFGMHAQRVRVRSAITRRDFVRSLFTAPPPPAISRARARSTRKRTQAQSPPTSPKRQASDTGFPFGGYFPGEDDDESTSTHAPVRSPSHQQLPSASQQWERGVATAYDGGPVPGSPMSGSTTMASSSVDLGLAPRLPNAIVLSGIENAGSAVHHTLSEILRTRTVVVDDEPTANASSPTRSTSPTQFIDSGSTWILPEPFIVVYVCVFDERERPPISKGLLDRFAFSMNLDLSHRPQSPPPRKPGLTREDILAFRHVASQVRIQPQLNAVLSALITGARHHPRLDGTLISLQCTRDLAAVVRANHISMGKRMSWIERDRDRERGFDMLDATADDATMMFRHVVGHRLRTRDCASDEVLGSDAHGAVLGLNEEGSGRRQGVRDIVAEIQSAVCA